MEFDLERVMEIEAAEEGEGGDDLGAGDFFKAEDKAYDANLEKIIKELGKETTTKGGLTEAVTSCGGAIDEIDVDAGMLYLESSSDVAGTKKKGGPRDEPTVADPVIEQLSKSWRENLYSRLHVLMDAATASARVREGGIVNNTRNVSLVYGPGFVQLWNTCHIRASVHEIASASGISIQMCIFSNKCKVGQPHGHEQIVTLSIRPGQVTNKVVIVLAQMIQPGE